MNDFSYNQNSEQKVDTILEKCPSCGANMKFDPDSQMLYCEHCGTKTSFEQNLMAQELDLVSGLEKDAQWKNDNINAFSCDNCGAKVVLNASETAKICPFCGTAHVTKVEELEGLRPNAVIPFTFGIDKATSFAENWAKKRPFAPNKFKKSLKTDNLKGVYTPCFTFDSNTTSYYQGRIGKRYTRVVGSGKNRRVETYIVWRKISGRHNDSFDDVLITAGKNFNQNLMDKLSPYNTNNSCEYNENFLLGYMGYHYDYEITDCWGSAKSKIDAVIKKTILSQYTYDVLDFLNVTTNHSDVKYKYVMLPVYIGNYKYGKKQYNFYINGSTGKITGKTPKSFAKIGSLILLGLGIVVGICLALLL